MWIGFSRPWRHVLIVAIATIVAGCAGDPRAVSLPSGNGPLPLEAGDRIRINVFGQDALATETVLANDGEVTLPLMGRIRLSDMTPKEAESAIGAKLRGGGLVVDPKVVVDVVKYRPIYVLGEVGKPGSYDYANNMTVVQAIALAGGYTYRARSGEASVVRHGTNHDNPVAVSETTQLQPGDVVSVPERWY